ncbi:hypothetical protein [Streptomyces mexicanus]|uniref:hypothetical protein n=1 Tax=Streptomyces mexicanus TaxID=178566 RepID=UPI0036581CE1
MKSKLIKALAAAALVAAGVAVTSEPASAQGARAEQANADCVFWHDSRTQGVACAGGPYEAWAKCDNGQTVYGRAVSNYSWSYAYCSSVGAYLRTGDVIFV